MSCTRAGGMCCTVPTACRPPTTTSIKPPVTISDEPLVAGSSPVESPIGHANVVWIIRWQSRQARDADLPRAFASDEWKAVLAEHPDRGGYLPVHQPLHGRG